jgi:hypothetical protein
MDIYIPLPNCQQRYDFKNCRKFSLRKRLLVSERDASFHLKWSRGKKAAKDFIMSEGFIIFVAPKR